MSGWQVLHDQDAVQCQFYGRLDRRVVIYSNAPDAIWLITGRDARMIPKKELFIDLKPNPNFQRDMNKMAEALRSGHAVLVYFDGVSRPYLPPEEEILSSIPLKATKRAKEGRVYVFSEASDAR